MKNRALRQVQKDNYNCYKSSFEMSDPSNIILLKKPQIIDEYKGNNCVNKEFSKKLKAKLRNPEEYSILDKSSRKQVGLHNIHYPYYHN